MATITTAATATLFTCISCGVAFNSADLQREHYRTDWHRYNLKRKVADLPPVAAEVFVQKVLAQQQKTKQDASKASFQAECKICGKVYYSANGYANHIGSKRHKELEAKAPVQEVASAVGKISIQEQPVKEDVPRKIMDEEDTSEEALLARIDEQIATSVRLTETMCLFCSHNGKSFEGNIDHMTKHHSFFIPDIEYIVDLRGLIKYLGEKIAIGHVCLYCNGKGKDWKSLEAVRKHMLDKGHTKIAYDAEKDRLEISDYYDFSTSYPVDEDEEDAEWEDVDEEIDDVDMEGEVVIEDVDVDPRDRELPPPARNTTAQPAFGDSDLELVLPSGARIGHRSLHRYYRQSLRPNPNADDPTIINRLLTHYSENQVERQPRRDRSALVGARNNGEAREARKHIKSFADQRKQYQFANRVAVKGNNQKHFRDQLLQ